ncbi:MAG: AMP-binding protein [Acutalibacteraceae bacterium]|nr:AMP-binding protein [Acutalibacteraceae bacterium]
MLDSRREYSSDKLSIYSFLKKHTNQYNDETAISFYGKKINYNCLFSKIDEMAKALIAHGVKKDDIVASSLPGCPEGIYLIYAINKIGAIYCAFDCRAKNEEIKETIKTFSPKLCFVPDFQLKEFHDIHDCKIIHLSPVHALGGAERFFLFLQIYLQAGPCFVLKTIHFVPMTTLCSKQKTSQKRQPKAVLRISSDIFTQAAPHTEERVLF